MQSKEKKLKSMLVIAAGFIVLSFIFKNNWFLLVSFLVAFFGSMWPSFTAGVTWFWFKLSVILGWINSRVLLGIVFFVFLFPIAFLMRVLSKGALKIKKEKGSYYTERNHTYLSGDLENTW